MPFEVPFVLKKIVFSCLICFKNNSLYIRKLGKTKK